MAVCGSLAPSFSLTSNLPHPLIEITCSMHASCSQQEVVSQMSSQAGGAALGKPGEAAHEGGLAPPAAKAKRVTRTDDGQSKQDNRVDDVVVHEDIVGRWQRRAPHQYE